MDDYGDNGDDSIALGKPELQVGEEPPEDGEDGEEPPDERGGGGGDGDGDEEGGGGDAARLSPPPSPAAGGGAGAGAASAVASSTDCAICNARGAAAAHRGNARSDCTVQCEIVACSWWFHPTCLPSQAELRTAKNAIIKKLPWVCRRPAPQLYIYIIICNIIERIL